MRPAIGFPRKDEVIICCPQQLVSGNLMKGAALAFCGFPHRVALTRGSIRDTNRPRAGGSMVGGRRLRRPWHPDERHLPAVRRPGRFRIVLCAGIEIDQCLFARTVDTDKAMVGSLAHESQGMGVRSPYQLGKISSCMKQRLWFVSARAQIGCPYLSMRDESNLVSRRRYNRVVTLTQLPRLATCRCDEPDVLADPLGYKRWIWIGASWKLRVTATDIDQVLAIGSPCYLIHFLSIVFVVRGQLSGHIFAGAIACCDSEIALALLVFYPGKATRLLAYDEAGSEGRGESLLEREALAACRRSEDKRSSQCEQCN